ncbi:Heterogeneous nuclear ribonucleoprotein 1 [Camellia lanceoleosa]|uniref:Heterogeneous nuclear ribonucleoprotein 1 n=1 Tax=Camellia lanceoleosa TaxID=1840588 RepID=A0ACC0I3A1_9ERIC|nr:Heterogeneous nuclear ribonucleoprotein 1 [Camellia lanceoleosa]
MRFSYLFIFYTSSNNSISQMKNFFPITWFTLCFPLQDHALARASCKLSRSSSSIQGSPGPGRTRKIFVGGLASTATEADFKKYFEQFGTITDVVVMYDHNTQRPRGFGFITYDSEDAVDKVLLKTFYELNGKMVEVKRILPKELSPGPNRTPLGGYNYGVSRINYAQGYSPSTIGGYGLRMDGRSFSPITSGRSGYAPFGSGYGMAMDGYDGGGNGGNSSFFSSRTGNLWGNGGLNYGTNSTSPSAYVGSGSGSIGGTFTNSGVNWGPSPISPQGGGNVEFVELAIKGTRNVLNACLKAKVKKVVVVSSVAAVMVNPNCPKDQPMDENCWSDPEFCKQLEDVICSLEWEAIAILMRA